MTWWPPCYIAGSWGPQEKPCSCESLHSTHQLPDAPPVQALLVLVVFIPLILIADDVAADVGVRRLAPPLGRTGAPVEVLLDALVEAL